MIRLGHIEYSNCLPVHGPLLDGTIDAGVEIVRGVPARLNAELEAGRIDVAPCSSIEYLRNADRYRIIPDLAIGSCGAVGSILLESALPLRELHGREVAVPTASATSVVLLRLLLERRLGVTARLVPFVQERDSDPVDDGAAAALRIGDPALRHAPAQARRVYDLGMLWTEWTGLPFAFAVWQTPLDDGHDAELRALHGALTAAHRHFGAHDAEYARQHAAAYGTPPDRLVRYWRALRYRLDASMQEGLLRFFALAAELGEAPRVEALRFTPAAAAD
jgi:chorismate dehydratase